MQSPRIRNSKCGYPERLRNPCEPPPIAAHQNCHLLRWLPISSHSYAIFISVHTVSFQLMRALTQTFTAIRCYVLHLPQPSRLHRSLHCYLVSYISAYTVIRFYSFNAVAYSSLHISLCSASELQQLLVSLEKHLPTRLQCSNATAAFRPRHTRTNGHSFRLQHCTKDLSQAFDLERRSVSFRPKKEVLQLFRLQRTDAIRPTTATAYTCLRLFPFSAIPFSRLFIFASEKDLRRNFISAFANRKHPDAIQIWLRNGFQSF